MHYADCTYNKLVCFKSNDNLFTSEAPAYLRSQYTHWFICKIFLTLMAFNGITSQQDAGPQRAVVWQRQQRMICFYLLRF